MIQRILVANRAEIASRVFRTCRRLGIATVAVHSDADTHLPYVAEADAAVRLPGNTPAETYLQAEAILDAARRAGADAIHPGYGFLSENAAFARVVQEAGLIWIGPSPESIEQMGSKIESKRLMAQAGVPLLANVDPASATEADLPLLVKASAGGGGRGMRIVRDLASLPSEVAAAEAEALSAFGDGTVFVEPYVERGRHVEVQVVGHADGVLVLGERDCSVQRRHQKVVEECPAPGLPDDVRTALHEAGAAAAAAIGYRGAGTVEFLYDADKHTFNFLEMNTRLQVEHPVTEEVFGVDLVAMQIAVAEGQAVDAPSAPTGHAVEVRLYAEDPAADYQPQSGILTRFTIPERDGVRVDAGFASGSEVSTYYDAMLAKVVVHAATREAAIRSLRGVLRDAEIHGLATNRAQLVEILANPTFLAAEMTTALLSGYAVDAAVPDEQPTAAAVAAALALAEQTAAQRTVQRGLPVAWRNVPSQPQRTVFEETDVTWWGGRDGYQLDGVRVLRAAPHAVTLEADGVATTYRVAAGPQRVDVDWPGGHAVFTQVPRFVDPAQAVANGSLLAPMPGTVVSVAVTPGQQVAAGDVVLVMEAMKMQHTVCAPSAGTVGEIHVQAGAQVAAGEVLAVVDEEEEEA